MEQKMLVGCSEVKLQREKITNVSQGKLIIGQN